ncbi:MAG TPA: imidazole glycerol phosphate synthase cyclase subunit [Methylophilaceae bacterium]|jgi:cyclase|nr:imidazole glycerol phosphate synthase cyclase subunit [Methylophilaceae bacterium]
MLKVRIIPTLLWKDFGLVKGVGFDSWRRVGSVLPAIKLYNSREVDELILVDITASRDGGIPDHDAVSDFSGDCAVPLTVGGGVANLNHMLALLHAGADKIAINTMAYARPEFIDAAASRFGAQCVVASIDVRKTANGEYRCFSHAGTVDAGKDVVSWARELASRGAGEILLTSIDRDGTMTGYDLDLVGRIVQAVDVPVIASGGAGSYQHMIDVVLQAGASAVAAASIFHFTEQTPGGAKLAMKAVGIPIRNNFVHLDPR